MNTSEAAKLIGITPRAVRYLLQSGELTGKLNGNSWDIDFESVEAAITNRKNLSEIEQYILEHRPNITLQQIANLFGVSKQRVHFLERRLDRRHHC